MKKEKNKDIQQNRGKRMKKDENNKQGYI